MKSKTNSLKALQLAKEKKRLDALLFYERIAWDKGFSKVAGLDEAGRGALAGPVVSAAVILPKNCFFRGLNDSKKLSKRNRELLFDQIVSHPGVCYSIAFMDHDVIDEVNILEATKLSMQRALSTLKNKPDYLLVDALDLKWEGVPCQGVIHGDSKSQSIAAASILAKVARDRKMRDQALCYPNYGFDKHVGYGTKLHREALTHFGPCTIHRKSFRPVREALLEPYVSL